MTKRLNITGVVVVLLLIILLSCVLTIPVFAAKKVRIQTPPVASALPLLWMQETGKLAGLVELDVIISPDHQRALALIAKDEVDMIVTGVNVGAKVYNKGVKLKLMNVNIWAVDYLLSNDPTIESWEELQGKSLSLPLRGGPLDFLARYFMQENGVNLEDVNIVYRPLPGAARYFMTGNVDTIILPEPLVTVTLAKSKKAELALDLQKEWGKLHDGDERIPFVGLLVSDKFVSKYPQLAKAINGMYMKGIEWVNENPEMAAKLGAKYFDIPPKILQTSFQRVNLNYFSQEENRKLVEEFFTEIMKIYPEMLGGKMPDEEFYF